VYDEEKYIMSRQDALEEHIKLSRILIFGGMGTFVVFVIQPIFRSYSGVQYWGFVIFGLLGLVMGIYNFWKFYNKLQELNKLMGKKYNSFFYLFWEMEFATLLMLIGFAVIAFLF